ncbi:MAG: site-2 protease family protein, partial [Gemmatimonadota bacterium]
MGGFRLGSVLGFEIRIDYSWFVIFFLVLWSFSAGVFPAQYPELSSAAYLAMGMIGTLLFFASLLAHELSHSVVARTKGIPVEGITLFIFGGMARTSMESETPE